MRGNIVVPRRFLEPEEIERFRTDAEAPAGRQVPFSIGIDGDRNARPNCIAHRFDPLDIDHRIGMADFELEAAETAVLDGAQAFFDETILGNRQPADIGIVSLELLLRGAA